MGEYASVDILAEFETEKVAKKAVLNLNKRFNKFLKNKLKEKGKTEFFTNLFKIEQNGDTLDIGVDSGRSQNAEWQSEELLDFFKHEYKKDLVSFSAEMMIPKNIIFYERDEEEIEA